MKQVSAMRKAVYGYQIYETVSGKRIKYFPKRSASSLEITKARVFDLTRKSRVDRTFDIWDGCVAVYKMTVLANGNYSFKPYLLEPANDREKLGYESDLEYIQKMRRNNQRTGRIPGDMSSWIKSGAGDRVLGSCINSLSYKSEGHLTQRKLGTSIPDFGHQPLPKRGKYAEDE